MIIACQSCNKKFDINQNLIPENGRLLQCSSCNHKWFFKNEIMFKTTDFSTNEILKVFENERPQVNKPITSNDMTIIDTNTTPHTDEVIKKTKTNNIKFQKKSNFLNLTIVFIISFVALIIILDTFKKPLGKILPNLEFLLYNLYESITYIKLFIKDLI